MKERPILFNGAMVRAILDGRKTQTRRVLNPQPESKIIELPHDSGKPELAGHRGFMDWKGNDLSAKGVDWFFAQCPYGQVGDRLWVRETWCGKYDDNEQPVFNAEGNLDSSCCWYRADGVDVRASDGDGFARYRKDGTEASPWVPSIHMPRWACRILLEIVEVRAERVQAISEKDAIAEGVIIENDPIPVGATLKQTIESVSIDAFKSLWASINSARSWDANPWVWVVEFKRVQSCPAASK